MKKKKGIPINRNSDDLKIPKIDEKAKTSDSRWGGIRAYWLDEKGEKKRTKSKFGLIKLTMKKLIALQYFSEHPEALEELSYFQKDDNEK